MKIKKISIIFFILNIFLLFLWYISIKHQNLTRLDTFFYSKILSLSNEKYPTLWEKEVVLLKIDKKFFSKLWITTSTFHRWYYAKALKKLKTYWVNNIVFDVYFWNLKYWSWTTAVQRNYNKSLKIFDEKLEKKIDEKVILWAIPNWKNVLLPSKKFLGSWAWIWHVKSHTNKEKINNWVYSYLKKDWKKILNLWYESYFNKLFNEWKIEKQLTITKQKSSNIFSPDKLKIKTSNKKYNVEIPLSKDELWYNYIFTPLVKSLQWIKSYSMYDILMDEDWIYESIFKNKTVFIWATDETLNDIKLSYIWIIPWVMFHINQFISIFENKYIYIAPIFISFIILFIIFLISYIFVVAFKDEKLSIITFTTFILFLIISFYYLFLTSWIIIPVWTISLILWIKLLIDMSHILFINQEKKIFITNLFNKYIWNKVLQKKWDNSKKVAYKKEIAIMFSDIKEFTNISENLQAQDVINMLNIYFEKTNTSIIKSKWFIDKYIWDAIMAFWEDVENIDNIINSIIQIQKMHPIIKNKINEKLWKKINLLTRIWLHYGEAVIWDVWDPKTKISYTAIWDSVNLASRLEWINKYYQTSIIVSESAYNKIENKENYAIRLIDKITVKWKNEHLKIYEVLLYHKNEINKELKNYINEFEKAILFYFNWNFKKTKEIFEKLEISKIWENDPLIPIFKHRTNQLIKNPPLNWDWIRNFTKK